MDYQGWHAPWAPQAAALTQGLPWMSPAAPGLYAALGHSRLAGWALRALAPALAEGVSIYWIDAGNRFDAHGLGESAKTLGRDGRQLLSRVKLSRPFNAYQLESVVCAKLPQIWRGEPVVLADPFSPLSDPDLPEADAQRVFGRLLQAIAALPAPWLALVTPYKGPPARARMLERLLRAAKRVLTLDNARLS